MRSLLDGSQRLTVVGGGFVGLETAATARALGKEVQLLESAPRSLMRSVSTEVADHAAHAPRQRHQRASVYAAAVDADLITPDQPLRIFIDASTSVSALLRLPTAPIACYVLAHGAGAGMTHRFLQAVADGLAERRVATLRYQFPYVERRSRRPDIPAVAHAAVRAACAAARDVTGLALVAGGKSFGGRMTSQAQALSPLPDVKGLAFLGFPLHAPDKPSSARAEHLSGVEVPMLFIQGTRDKLADFPRMTQVVAELGPNAALMTIEHADHGFDVRVRSGRTPEEVMCEVLDGLAAWIGGVV